MMTAEGSKKVVGKKEIENSSVPIIPEISTSLLEANSPSFLSLVGVYLWNELVE